jgi:sortase A
LQGVYRYRVVSTKVVSPQDVEVLDSTGGEVLTLVTCYPFYFVGAAPNRFIVRAERFKG